MIIGELIDHGEHMKQVLRGVVVPMRLAVSARSIARRARAAAAAWHSSVSAGQSW